MKLTLITLITLSTTLFANEKFKLIHAQDLEKLLQDQKAKVAVFDANNEKTRKKEGIIPGAKLLSSIDKFEVKELPTEKNTTLVFYCANTQCTASHTAAERALENGYTDVNVMADGIQGWKKAGKPSTKL